MPVDKLGVQVSGLREVRAALRRLGDTESLTDVREALKDAAGVVAEDARRRVPVRSGRARDSIRPTASGNRAFVQGGKASVPYYGWLDFGSRQPISGRPRSVGPWASPAPRGPEEGRFIYPALDATRGDVVDALTEAIERAAHKEGLS